MIAPVSSNFDAHAARLRSLYPSSRGAVQERAPSGSEASDPNADLVVLGEEEEFRRRYAKSLYVRPRSSPALPASSPAMTSSRPSRHDLRTRWNKQRYA